MNENKARLILYYSYESFKILMLIVSGIKKIEKEGYALPIKKETVLNIAGKISHDIHYKLYKYYDELKYELDYLENLRKNTEPKLTEDITVENLVYLSVIAFKNLGGKLIPYFLNENSKDTLELEIRKTTIKESEKIIKEIINPFFRNYPEIKKEIDILFDRYIKFI